jgi:hypothetical protein
MIRFENSHSWTAELTNAGRIVGLGFIGNMSASTGSSNNKIECWTEISGIPDTIVADLTIDNVIAFDEPAQFPTFTSGRSLLGRLTMQELALKWYFGCYNVERRILWNKRLP